MEKIKRLSALLFLVFMMMPVVVSAETMSSGSERSIYVQGILGKDVSKNTIDEEEMKEINVSVIETSNTYSSLPKTGDSSLKKSIGMTLLGGFISILSLFLLRRSRKQTSGDQ